MKKTWRWLGLAIYVAVIYATLGSVRAWADVLRQHGLAQGLYGLGLAILIAGLFWVGGWPVSFRLRLQRLGIAVLFLVTAGLLEFPEERMHLMEYGILGWMVGWALAGSERWPGWWPAGLALVWMVGYGDELIQAVLPNRVYDLRDILLNGFAGMAGLVVFNTNEHRM